jgi:hypothetical protein
MRTTLRAALAALALLAAAAATGADEPKKAADPPPSDFFDGKTLEGWVGQPGWWSVKDGAIVGAYTDSALKHNTFLWTRKKYRDFELHFQIRLKDGEGNSGVQVRSFILDPDLFTASGPQCDIGQQFWGSLYGENFGGMMKASNPDLVKKVLKPNDFNDYYIKVVGNHVTIKLNGETTVDDDFPHLPDEGRIGWQMHAGFKYMEVTFKDIEFKELKGK